MKFESRWTQTIFVILLTYLIFSLSRVAFFVFSSEAFVGITSNELTSALLLGLAVDSDLIFTFLGGVFLLLALPIKLLHAQNFKTILGLYYATVTSLMLAINIADILYFSTNSMHISSSDITFIFTIFSQHLGALLFTILLAMFIFAYSLYIFRANIEVKEHEKSDLIFVIFLALSTFLATAKIVNIDSRDLLATNGAYYFSKSYFNKEVKQNVVSYKDALSSVKKLIESEKCRNMGIHYPIFRYYAGHTQLNSSKKPNVVLIVSDRLKTTPYIKELSKKSLTYNNFYLSSDDKFNVLVSILSGFTLSNKQEIELSKLSFLAKLANNNFYDTLFIENSDDEKVKKLAKTSGFKNIFKAQGAIFDFAYEKLEVSEKPFISLVLDSSKEPNFDKSLKNFLTKSRSRSWFNNTIFIITTSKKVDASKNYKVPFIVYAPKYFDVNEREFLASDVDILPSLMDILRFNDGFATISNSIFDRSVKSRFVLSYEKNIVSFEQNGTIVYYDNIDFLPTEGNVSQEADLQKSLLSIEKVKLELIKSSKWSK